MLGRENVRRVEYGNQVIAITPRAMSSQPTLETPRLTLRPFVPEDGPTVERLAGAREVAETTLTIPHPYPPGGGAMWIATHASGWESGTTVTFAMVDRATNE